MFIAGAVHKKELIRVLKMAAAVAPQVRSMALLAIIDPKEYLRATGDPAYRASLNLCEETIFWMDLNIDGISLFKSSKAPQVHVIFNIHFILTVHYY